MSEEPRKAKPSLSAAPNGIVGSRDSTGMLNLGQLLTTTTKPSASHSGATVPIVMAQAAQASHTRTIEQAARPSLDRSPTRRDSVKILVKAKPPRVQLDMNPRVPNHSRSRSDQGLGGSGNTSPRGSPRLQRRSFVDNPGPLMPDTRQREIIQGSSPSSSSSSLAAPNLRRGSSRKSVRLENPGPLQQDSQQRLLVESHSPRTSSRRGSSRKSVMFDRSGSMSSMGQEELVAPEAVLSGKGGLFSLRGRTTPRTMRRMQEDEANETMDGKLLSDSGEGKKQRRQVSSIFGRGTNQQQNSGNSLIDSGTDLPVTSGAANSGGFLAKLRGLKNRREATRMAEKEKNTTPVKKQFVFSAPDLEAREAQLEAAGFAKLPGTLLSRAKGEALDNRFLLKWSQFELRREIGEGAYAMVYLANAALEGGSTKLVAVKELKLQGNEANEDIRLEVAAVADAIHDCGFPTVAETIRIGSKLLRNPETYEDAKSLIGASLADFRTHCDMEDEACTEILAVMEALVELPPPPNKLAIVEGKGAPERLLEDVMREVEVLSKLWHKNVVEFIGCCVQLPHLAIAMQFADKGPLSEILINDQVILNWEMRIKWARETAEALEYLHGLDPKIIHR